MVSKVGAHLPPGLLLGWRRGGSRGAHHPQGVVFLIRRPRIWPHRGCRRGNGGPLTDDVLLPATCCLPCHVCLSPPSLHQQERAGPGPGTAATAAWTVSVVQLTMAAGVALLAGPVLLFIGSVLVPLLMLVAVWTCARAALRQAWCVLEAVNEPDTDVVPGPRRRTRQVGARCSRSSLGLLTGTRGRVPQDKTL